MVGGPVEADDLSSEIVLSLAQATSSSISRVSQSAKETSALSTILVSSPARSIGMVLTTTAPALVAASQQATIAGLLADRIRMRLPGLHAIVLDQGMRDAVGPVGQLLVGAAAAIADQRGMVAEALARPCIGQFHAGVQAIGIIEAVEQQIRPLVRRRQPVAGESINMRRWSKHHTLRKRAHASGMPGLESGRISKI